MMDATMSRAVRKTATVILLSALAAIAQAADRHEPDLSPAQNTAIAKQIATLRSSIDRQAAGRWSNSKKVAELICRPTTLPILKKQFPDADRVFLGTSDPKTLTLETNAKLTGTGQVRTSHGWQDFTFTCNVNPQTGKVTSFQSTNTP
jgi:hypothetical protein